MYKIYVNLHGITDSSTVQLLENSRGNITYVCGRSHVFNKIRCYGCEKGIEKIYNVIYIVTIVIINFYNKTGIILLEL